MKHFLPWGGYPSKATYPFLLVTCMLLIGFGFEATAQRTPSLGTSQVFNASTTYRAHVSRVDDSHIFVMYKDGSSATSNDLMGRVGEVDTASQTVSWGTAVTLEADAFRYGTPVVLNDSTAVVAYELDAVSDSGYARVVRLDVTSDAITSVGARYVFEPGDIDAAFSHVPLNMQALSGNTFALLYADATDDGTIRIGTVSGLTLSFGTAQVFSTGDVQNMSITALASDKVFVTYEDDGSSDVGVGIVGVISGTSISYGSAATFETSGISYTACSAIDSNRVAIAYILDDANDYCYSRVATVNGTSIAYTSSISVETSQDARDLSIDYLTGEEFVLAYNGGTGDDSKVIVGEISGSGTGASIAYSTAQVFWNDEGDDSRVATLNENAFVLAYVDDSNNDSGEVIVATLPDTGSGSSCVLSVSTSGNSITCHGSSDGSATALASGGTGSYSYAWSTGGTSSTITSLTAGTYTVTVSDGSGCVGTGSITLSQPDSLTIGLTTTDVSCNGGADGSATATVSGGTAAYTFLWSSGSTSSVLTGLAAGTYTLTVTDANGCTATAQAVISQPTAISTSITVNANELCAGDSTGAMTVSASGGATPYSYTWSNGDTTAAITGLGGGMYTVTVTDDNGCTTTESALVDSPPELVVTVTVSNFISCFNFADGQLEAFAAGGTGPYTYLWNTGSDSTFNIDLPVGMYDVIVTDANGCTASDTAELQQPPALIISSNLVGNVSCNGGADGVTSATTVGGTQPYALSWSNGTTTTFNSGLTAGVYTLTVTDDNGCVEVDSVEVTEPEAITVSAAIDDETCEGDHSGLVNITPSGGVLPYTYAWSNSATTQDAVSVTSGVHTVTITDSNGCVFIDSFTVGFISPQPQVSLGPDTIICSELKLALFGGIFTSYQWNTGATTQSIFVDSPAVYILVVTDSVGCMGTDSIDVDTHDCLGVQQLVDAASFRVFPNPSDGHMILEATSKDGMQGVRLINMMGQAVFEERFPSISRKELDLTALPPGTYMMSVWIADEIRHVPVILRR